jgi:hypothetical protein
MQSQEPRRASLQPCVQAESAGQHFDEKSELQQTGVSKFTRNKANHDEG